MSTNARAWLTTLSQLGVEDLRRISRLVDLLTTADRAKADTARTMLDAKPEPLNMHDARARVGTIVAYLE